MVPVFQRLFAAEEEVERPKAAKETPERASEEVATKDRVSGQGTEHVTTVASQCPVRESPSGLIPASKLPSAVGALAELFAEAPSAERSSTDKAAESPKVSERKVEEPATDGAPKRRGLLARLLTFKRPPVTAPEKLIASEEDGSNKTSVETLAEAGREVGAKMEANTTAEPSGETESLEFVNNAFADFAASKGMPEPPILAETLPSAADDFERLFPSEQTSAEAATDISTDMRDQLQEEVRAPESTKASGEVRVEALVGLGASIVTEPSLAEKVQTPTASYESAQIDGGVAFNADTRHGAGTGPTSVEPPVEVRRGAARLGSNETYWPYESPYPAAGEPLNREHASEKSAQIPEDAWRTTPAEKREELFTPNSSKPEAPQRPYKEWAFDEKLASHREWVESHGLTGQRADLSGAEMEASDLISVNLRLADLHDANLRASDLLLADLRDACLVRADLEEACLVGANLEGANLEGASLETAMGLVPRQFAGANLRDALLAPQLMEFEAVAAFQRASQTAFRYFGAMTAASMLSWLVIWKTRDAQLLTDSAIIPFLHSHAAAAALPTVESYLIVPVALFILYLLFHFHLQRLWDSVMELPAIFPDGHALGDRGPGMISGLLRTHFRWMNPDPSSTRMVEKGVSLLAAYWIVPATLLLFWARYLTRQEIHGTILQALLVVIATGIAAYATTKVGRPQERWAFEKKWAQRLIAKIQATNPISVASVLGIVLLLLSAGTIAGVPHDRSRAPQYGPASVRRWAANAFWWMAYDPYPDLTEASISRRPTNWNGADEEVAFVDGLRTNNARFRYAQAYGAFLANSHLWRADFRGAFLSEADLRGADLGQSNMRFAVMDHTQMNHANLDRSNLDGADLRRADLRYANLSYCSLVDAVLVDARLDGASLYTARLTGATMTRANLGKADLRESYLDSAHMDHVDLRNAYLWSARLPGADLGGAQMESAILIDANLQGANLGGAQLTGTVLNGADLTGTSLEGTDLRGALGLSASQVCSAKSRRGVVLDPNMQTQVEAQCGK